MLEWSWQMFGWSTCIHTGKISLVKHVNFMLGHITCKNAKFIVIACHSRCLPLTSALAATYTMCTFQNSCKQMFWSMAFLLFPSLPQTWYMNWSFQDMAWLVESCCRCPEPPDSWPLKAHCRRHLHLLPCSGNAYIAVASQPHSGRKQLWCLPCWQHLHNLRKGPTSCINQGSFRNDRYLFLRTLSIYHIDLQSFVRLPDFSALSLALHPTTATLLLWSATVLDLQ